MNQDILVTGGAGFIGSHTVVELVKAGYNPIILDSFSNSQPSVLDGITKIIHHQPTFYKGDFANTKLLDAIIGRHKIHGVIHFAAFKAVGELGILWLPMPVQPKLKNYWTRRPKDTSRRSH